MLVLLILFLFLPINLASPTSKQTEGHVEEKLEALEDNSPTLVEWLANDKEKEAKEEEGNHTKIEDRGG